MNKIINGLKYDTEKAIKIGENDSGLLTSDFNYWCDTLFVTPKNNYFLWQELYNNETIHVFSKQDAFTWASKHLSGEIVEQYFPNMVKEA